MPLKQELFVINIKNHNMGYNKKSKSPFTMKGTTFYGKSPFAKRGLWDNITRKEKG